MSQTFFPTTDFYEENIHDSSTSLAAAFLGPDWSQDADGPHGYTARELLGGQPEKLADTAASGPRQMAPSGDGSGDKAFRFRGKDIFLTYPRCPWSAANDIIARLWQLGFRCGVVGWESHEDGGQHVHVLAHREAATAIIIADGLSVATSDGERRANIQTARSTRRVFGYVAKTGQYQLWGQENCYEKYRTSRPDRRTRGPVQSDEFAKKLIGKSEREVLDIIGAERPGYALQRNLGTILANLRAIAPEDQALAKRSVEEIELPGAGTFCFSADTTCRGQYEKAPRGSNRHLYLHGQPGVGKSTIVSGLRGRGYRIYAVNDMANWAGYDSSRYDAILFDTFSESTVKQDQYRILESMMDGNEITRVNIKNGHGEHKKRKLFIFLSNYAPEEYVKHPIEAGAFFSRVHVYHMIPGPDKNKIWSGAICTLT